MTSLKLEVYLEIPAELEKCELSDKYREIMRKYADSIPTSYWIRWNPLAIPDAGQRIALYCCSGDLAEVTVQEVEYGFKKGKVTAYVRLKPEHSDDHTCFVLDEQNMQELATIEALVENFRSTVGDALQAAGLLQEHS